MKRSNNTCSTCTGDVNSPYRHYDKQGNIIEGCIDPCHDQYLPKMTNTYNWVMQCRKNNRKKVTTWKIKFVLVLGKIGKPAKIVKLKIQNKQPIA